MQHCTPDHAQRSVARTSRQLISNYSQHWGIGGIHFPCVILNWIFLFEAGLRGTLVKHPPGSHLQVVDFAPPRISYAALHLVRPSMVTFCSCRHPRQRRDPFIRPCPPCPLCAIVSWPVVLVVLRGRPWLPSAATCSVPSRCHRQCAAKPLRIVLGATWAPIRSWECPVRTVRMQCKVLYVSNFLNPSFGPFSRVCCSITGFFMLLVH